MLIATHEMGFTRDIADRVCLLEEGRILEQGPPEKIFPFQRTRGRPASSAVSSRPAGFGALFLRRARCQVSALSRGW